MSDSAPNRTQYHCSNAPRFSILTPVYNGEKVIERCIKSVSTQTFQDYEHIIIDDGSTDNTMAIVESFAEDDLRIRVVSSEHEGVAKARAMGMAAARGELFARLDADDEFTSTYLEEVDRMFSKHSDADIVSTNGYQVYADGTRVFYYTDPIFQSVCSLTLEDMLRGHMFGTSAVMRKEVFPLTGGSRPETYSEDPDLWLRAVALGATHYHIPKPIFLYYQDQPKNARITGNTRAIWQSHIEIFEHLIDSGLLRKNEIRLAQKRICALRLRLLLRWDRWGTPLRIKMKRL